MRLSNSMLFRIALLLLLSSCIMGCSSGPRPIEIGKDLCELCKMTIMDKRYGAEIITSKGKIYKFDSAECLIEYVKKYPTAEYPVRSLLVIDHSAPGEFIEAEKAFYLHSEKLPSPMGANLSAVKKKETIDTYFTEYGGDVWTWEEARRRLQ